MSDEKESQPTAKTPRTRSPAYPAIDLGKALEKAKIIWEKAGRHEAAVETVLKFLDYEPKSSTGNSAVSAIKKFGLVAESGTGTSRTLKISDLGLRLVFNPDPSSTEYQNHLKQAALAPSIHLELWEKYEGNLPDDAVISRYLVVERSFNQAYVGDFIKQFRATIKLANLKPGDIVDHVVTDSEDEDQSEPSKKQSRPPQRAWQPSLSHPKPPAQTTPPPQVTPPANPPLQPGFLSIPVGIDGRAALVPLQIRKAEFDLFIETLKLWERRIVKRPPQFITISGITYRAPTSWDKAEVEAFAANPPQSPPKEWEATDPLLLGRQIFQIPEEYQP